MRIVFVSQPRDPIAAGPRQRGSVAIVLAGLAHALAPRHEVTVIAPRAPDQAEREITEEGLRIRRLSAGSRNLHRALDLLSGLLPGAEPHLLAPSYHAGYQRAVLRALAEDPPDLVHVMVLGPLVERLARALPAVPRVLHLHDDFLLHFDRARARRRLAAASAVVVPSPWLARAFAAAFPEAATKIRALPNGVDLDRFRPDPKPAPRGGERLLFVGRLSPEKGVHVAVEAFARLAPHRPGLRLELVGEPGLLPYAYLARAPRSEALAAALAFYGRDPLTRFWRELVARGSGYREAVLAPLPPEIRARIGLSGSLAHDRLPELYRSADLLLAPSVCQESFCLPVAEALASGLPVVASRCGGPTDLLGARDGSEEAEVGLVVPKGDAVALANAIETLLADPERRRRMGEAGRRRAEAELAWPLVAARLERIYAELRSG
ncbi:MAG: glycosyltransferase family 4 protein [Geminicoccaceae bacterium]|nr:glycosyltransferase family 4 protein [Geminicoccaceae bacterium]